jgi:hypothetical protein
MGGFGEGVINYLLDATEATSIKGLIEAEGRTV